MFRFNLTSLSFFFLFFCAVTLYLGSPTVAQSDFSIPSEHHRHGDHYEYGVQVTIDKGSVQAVLDLLHSREVEVAEKEEEVLRLKAEIKRLQSLVPAGNDWIHTSLLPTVTLTSSLLIVILSAGVTAIVERARENKRRAKEEAVLKELLLKKAKDSSPKDEEEWFLIEASSKGVEDASEVEELSRLVRRYILRLKSKAYKKYKSISKEISARKDQQPKKEQGEGSKATTGEQQEVRAEAQKMEAEKEVLGAKMRGNIEVKDNYNPPTTIQVKKEKDDGKENKGDVNTSIAGVVALEEYM